MVSWMVAVESPVCVEQIGLGHETRVDVAVFQVQRVLETLMNMRNLDTSTFPQ